MAETAELNEISRSIKGAMGESAGQFRQAAAAGYEQISKIVKDISKTFAAQRKDIVELGNTIEDSVHASEQVSSKLDQQTSVFQELLSLQTTMQSDMRNVASNIKILNNSVNSLDTNMSNALIGSGTGSVIGALKDLPSSMKAIGLIGGAAVAATAAGAVMSSGGGGALGPGVGESGSSSEAMSFFQSKGWSKEQSAGIVGNLQVESGKSLKTNAVGDGGQAYGIAQWHPDRQAKFQQVMGVPIRQSNFKQQLEFVQWELMNTEKRAGEMLKGASSAIEAARAVDYGYERSTHQHLGQRMSNAAALAKSSASDTASMSTTTADATPTSAPSPTADATPQPTTSANMSLYSSSAMDAGGMAGHGHGPISGSMEHGGEHKAEGKLSGVQPGILQKFEQIQSQAGTPLTVTSGFRDPKHNAEVGGAKNSAHMRGNAIDVSFGGGIPQALKLIEAASKAGIGGIGVYSDSNLHFDTETRRAWGKGYHFEGIAQNTPWASKAIEAHLSGQWGKYDPSAAGGDVAQRLGGGESPVQGPPMPGMDSSGGSGGGESTATPTQQPNIAQTMMGPQAAGIDMGSIAGMIGGMLPGGIGGIVGTMLPLLTSALGSLEMPSLQESPNAGLGDMIQSLSSLSSSGQTMNQAAIQKQAQQETIQEQNYQQAQGATNGGGEISASNNGMAFGGDSYAYNLPWDTGWPDWLQQLGGNHYKEMSSIKTRVPWG